VRRAAKEYYMNKPSLKEQLFCHLLVFLLFYGCSLWLFCPTASALCTQPVQAALLQAARELIVFPFGSLLQQSALQLSSSGYFAWLQLLVALLWSVLVVYTPLLVAGGRQERKQ